jgi:peptidoglycan/LPS O-acetylase OafA/YrhL
MIVSAFLLLPMKTGMTMSQFYHRRFLCTLPPFICFLVLYAVLPATWGGLTWDDAIQKAPRWINSLAKLTFGMYLMHIFFLTFIAEWIINGDVATPILPVWLAIPIIGLLTFLCCAVTTKLISQIPGSKYIIG